MTATISGSAVSTLVALTTTGNTILGDASTDTLNVGNGDLVKDASGNVGIGTSSPTSFFASADNLVVGTTSGNNGLTILGGSAATAILAFGYSTGTAAGDGSNRAKIYYDGPSDTLRMSAGGALMNSSQFVLDASGNLLMGTTTANGKVTVAGTVGISVSPGTYTFDVSPTGTTIANGGTVNYSNSSGFLILNNWSQGTVGIWLMGGGSASLVSSTSAVGLGAIAHNSGINGYTWTSTFGSTAVYNFVFIRTRPGA